MSAQYIACRFPSLISFQYSGGAGYTTGLVQQSNGFEFPSQTDPDGLGSWTVSHNARYPVDFDALNAFFRVMRGKYNRFPFKDWTDFQVTAANGALAAIASDGSLITPGFGSGWPVYQLCKRYDAQGYLFTSSVFRRIQKPVPEFPPLVYKNGVLVPEGVAAGDWEVDLSQGLVTFVAASSHAITAITNANPGVVTSAGHGFPNGRVVFLHGIGGMTELNGPFAGGSVATVASTATNTFALSGIDTTDFGAFTSGGTAAVYPQPSDVLTWVGQFDVPCRFDTDQMDADLAIDKAGQLYISGWKSIAIREVKITG